MSAGPHVNAATRRAPGSAGGTPRAAGPALARAPSIVSAVPFDHYEDEFRLDLSDIDIPRMRPALDVEGLRPTWLSRLLDWVAPLAR